jgi:hypothetical protein
MMPNKADDDGRMLIDVWHAQRHVIDDRLRFWTHTRARMECLDCSFRLSILYGALGLFVSAMLLAIFLGGPKISEVSYYYSGSDGREYLYIAIVAIMACGTISILAILIAIGVHLFARRTRVALRECDLEKD